MKIGLDTSIIVNLIRRGTPEHDASWAWYLPRKETGEEFIITDHALLEAFSVLTRIPPPYQLAPKAAELVLQNNFGTATIAPIHPGFSWQVIPHTISRGFWGGRIYDAAIALATYEAGARLLLTWNVKHFISVAPVGLEIRQP